VYYGSNVDQLPIIDFHLQGGSFCQGEDSSLIKKWPLFDTENFFKPSASQENPYCPVEENNIPQVLGEGVGEKYFFE
jgi:hypothetical protein